MPEDHRKQILLIHLAAYVGVTALLAAVNLWLAPDNLWFVWVALGWGIGVAAHGLAYWLRRTHRRERVFIDRKARGFTVHLFAYAATILILFVVNLTMTPKVWWFYWVALGWGAGLAAHAWCVFHKQGSEGAGARPRRLLKRRAPLIEFPEEPKAPAKQKLAARPRKALAPKKRAAPRKKPAKKPTTSRKSPRPKR